MQWSWKDNNRSETGLKEPLLNGESKMARTIKYIPRNNQARTEYREISDQDRDFVLSELIKIMAIMAELDQLADEDTRWVRDQWWHKRTNKIRAGRNGSNSPCSMVGGLVYNFVYKQPVQRDLSDHQMADIEYITHILTQVYAVEAIRFQIGFE